MVSSVFDTWHAIWGSTYILLRGIPVVAYSVTGKLTSTAWMLAGMLQGFRKSGLQTWMQSETKLASWSASLQVPLEWQVKTNMCSACNLTTCSHVCGAVTPDDEPLVAKVAQPISRDTIILSTDKTSLQSKVLRRLHWLRTDG